MNVIHEKIISRRSIRKYAQKPVPKETLVRCLDAARLSPSAANRQPLKYVAVVVGVGMAFAYSLDLLNAAFEIVAEPAWVGILLTGLAVGRGSNYVHDLWSTYLKPQV